MRIYSSERRFGLRDIRQTTSRKWTNFDVNGNVTGSGVLSSTSMFQKRHYRADKSSNPVKPLPGKPGSLWRRPSNYSRTICEVTYLEGSVNYKDSTGKIRRNETGMCTNNGVVNFGPHISSSLSVINSLNTDNRANVEALLKLKDMKVNFGEALAESRSTVKHLASTAQTLAQAVLYARRGRWDRVHKLFGLSGRPLATGKSAATRWLEYQFAWTPLMSDIYGTSELLKKGLREKAQLFSVQRNLVDIENVRPSGDAIRSYGTSKRTTRVKLYAQVSDASIANLTSLGLLDPLQVGWALVPYSFVIDWFLPVGNLLEALGATRGLTFVGGHRTYTVESISTHYWRPPAYLGMVGDSEMQVVCSAFATRRVRLDMFPAPGFYLKSPFSSSHLISGLALVRQLFK